MHQSFSSPYPSPNAASSNVPTRSMQARLMNMQKPTAVGISGYWGTPARRQASAHASGSSGTGEALQNVGSDAISPLLVKGVIEAIMGSDAAQRLMRRSQSPAGMVSELSRTTSRPPDSRIPRLAVATKPRFWG